MTPSPATAVNPSQRGGDRDQVTLANFWHPVATSDEVTTAPTQFMLLGELLVMFRVGDSLTCLSDLCIHRGAALSLGWVTDGQLTCRYHGWQYDREGRCVNIPSLPAGVSIPPKARAIAYQVKEAYGLVWVALAEPVQPIPPWPDDAYDDPQFHTFLLYRKVWKSSAGRACENGMDFSHFNFVHKGYTELANGPVIVPHTIDEDDFRLHYTYPDANTCREYILYAPFSLYLKKYAVKTHTNSTDWDARSTPEGGMTIITQFHSPRDAVSTDVYVHIGRNHSLDVDDETFAGELGEFVLEQDREIVESQRPERIPTDLREELHLKVPDATGIAYRRLLSRIGSADAFMP